MVFQGEDTPLSEDILKKPPAFIPTWVEWSAQNRPQILFWNLTSTTANIYTVPAKNTLWITAARLVAKSDGLGSIGTAFVTITPGIVDGQTNLLHVNFPNNGADNATLSYPMPIKVEEGSTILVEARKGFAQGQIFGFLEPKRIS